MKRSTFILSIISFSVIIAKEPIGINQNTAANNNHRDNGPDVSVININNLSYWIVKDGAYTTSGSPNGTQADYPAGTGSLIYADGMLWGAKVKNDGLGEGVRVGGSTYYNGMKAGRVIIDSEGNVLGSDDPVNNHVWRVRKDWETANLTQDAAIFYDVQNLIDVTQGQISEIKNQYEYDWMNWPAPWGAPYEDVDSDGFYDPTVDIPGEPGSDQTMWIIANDVPEIVDESGNSIGYQSTAPNLYGADPIGVELQITLWAYNFGTDKPLGNMVFKRSRLKYTGLPNSPENSVIDTMYFAQWSDPDLGDYMDDFVGSDIDLSLGYVYNGNVLDGVFDGVHDMAVPAGGYDFLQGPPDNIDIDNDGNTNEYLGMTSFTYFGAGSSISDPDLVSYSGSLQFFNLMEGFLPRPEYPIQVPWVDPVSGLETKYALSGDPITGEGWIDGIQLPPGDRRMVMSSGPFKMNLDDTADIVVGIIGSLGSNNLESVRKLKIDDEFVQIAYDSDYNLLGYDFNIISSETDVTNIRLNVYTSESVTSVSADLAVGANVVVNQALQLTNTGYYTADIQLNTSPAPYEIHLSISMSNGDNYNTGSLNQKITTWNPFNITGHEVIYDNLSNDGVLNIGDLADISVIVQNTDNTNSINDLRGRVINVVGPIEYLDNQYVNFGSSIEPGSSYSSSMSDSYFTVKISDSAQTGDSLEIMLRLSDQSGNIWEKDISMVIQSDDNISDSNNMEHTTGNADGSLTYRVVRSEDITGHSYEISFSEYMGSNNRSTLDCSQSSASGYAMVADGGTIDLYIEFSLGCPGGAWVDGINYTFPANFSANINNYYFSEGNICSYGSGSGQNCDNLEGTFDGDVLSFGDNDQSGFGAFESSNTLVINVNPWFSGDFTPIEIGFLIYDDGYDGNPVDANGTFTIENILLYPLNTLVMNVKNYNLNEILLVTDDFPNEEGTNVDIIDGFKIFKGTASYGKPIDFSDIIYNLNLDAAAIYGEATYDMDSYAANGWAETAQATDTYGAGIDSPGILGRDIQIRFTGDFVDQPITTDNGVVYYAAQQTGGSYAWISGARISALEDHPDPYNTGDGAAFRIKIPFEVWDMEAEGGPQQIDIDIYDRKQSYNEGDTVYAFNPYDRMYTHFIHHAYQEDGLYTDGGSGIPTDFFTWNVVWWDTQFNQGDVLTFVYDNTISYEDKFVFTPEVILSNDDSKIIPESYNLSQNYPNPFNPITNIRYSLPKNTMTSLIIYNILGQEVVKLIDKEMNKGSHLLQWDGKNNLGELVGTGLYYYKLETKDYVNTKKMLFLK